MSYILIFIGTVTQTIGGHYTFSRVPFEDISKAFGYARNMYDRVGHFALGLFAYPIAEYLYRRKLVTKGWLVYFIPILALFAVASVYEIIERLYSTSSGGANSAAFLGSQGDKWDSQEDMLSNGLGAIISILLFLIQNRKKIGISKMSQ